MGTGGRVGRIVTGRDPQPAGRMAGAVAGPVHRRLRHEHSGPAAAGVPGPAGANHGHADGDLRGVRRGAHAGAVLAGSSSDRLGRRPVVLPFIALSAVASGLFVVAVHSVALLYVARFLQGVVFSVLSAWLQDVSGHSRPQVAARRATLAMTLGFSLGPLTSGLLAQWGPAPTMLPYLAHIVAVTTGLVAVFSVPETVTEPRPGRLVQLRLPTGSAPAFWLVVAPTAFCVYAFPAMSVSSLPLLVDLGSKRLAVLGVIGAVTLGAGTLVQPAGQRLREWSAPVGAACGAAGFALSLVVLAANAWPVLLAVGVLLGAGSGLCQLAGLTLIARLAPPQTRGALNSAFYAAAYAGFATPWSSRWWTGGSASRC